MIRQVDSSLMDEWEKMRDPNYQANEQTELRPPGAEEAAQDITRDKAAFTATLRTRVFMFLRGLVNQDYEGALDALAAAEAAPDPISPPQDGEQWTSDRLRQAMDAYYVDHARLCLDPEARNGRHTYVTPSEDKRT